MNPNQKCEKRETMAQFSEKQYLLFAQVLGQCPEHLSGEDTLSWIIEALADEFAENHGGFSRARWYEELMKVSREKRTLTGAE
jgi:hypothetical protein